VLVKVSFRTRRNRPDRAAKSNSVRTPPSAPSPHNKQQSGPAPDAAALSVAAHARYDQHDWTRQPGQSFNKRSLHPAQVDGTRERGPSREKANTVDPPNRKRPDFCGCLRPRATAPASSRNRVENRWVFGFDRRRDGFSSAAGAQKAGRGSDRNSALEPFLLKRAPGHNKQHRARDFGGSLVFEQEPQLVIWSPEAQLNLPLLLLGTRDNPTLHFNRKHRTATPHWGTDRR